MARTSTSTKTAPATVAGGSAFDRLSKLAASKPASKGKEAKPNLHDPSLNDAIEAFILNKEAAESAQALADAAKEQVLEKARPFRLAECAKAGKVMSSVTVNGKLSMSQSCKYCAVPQGQAAVLEAAFGDEFGDYFQPTLSISLAKASANSPEVLQKMFDELGEDFVMQHFEVKRDLLVTERFHNDFTTRTEVQKLAAPHMADQTIKPYAATLTVK